MLTHSWSFDLNQVHLCQISWRVAQAPTSLALLTCHHMRQTSSTIPFHQHIYCRSPFFVKSPAHHRLTDIQMAGSTKYQAAPQRDSFEESSYSQAPPSYVDEPSAANDQATLLGGPRSSEDNIPDDFKVCGVVCALNV